MKSVKEIILFLVTFAVVPSTLGIILYRDNPAVPTSSYSTSPNGHKALYQLLSAFNYQLSRRHIAIDKRIDESATLIAIEPGGTFFRDFQTKSDSFVRWLQDGNSALITLDSDPDSLAQRDDREIKRIAWMQRAKDSVANLEETVTTTNGETRELVPSSTKRKTEGPSYLSKLSKWLTISIQSKRHDTLGFGDVLVTKSAKSPLDGLKLRVTRPRLLQVDARYELVTSDAGTLVAAFPVGKGSVFVLSEPRLFQNMNIARGENAIFALRLIEGLVTTPKTSQLIFEEFSHAVAQRYTWSAFFLDTPNVYLFMSFLLILVIAVWQQMPREFSPKKLKTQSLSAQASMTSALAGLYRLTPSTKELASAYREYSLLRLKYMVYLRGDTNLYSALAETTSLSQEELESIFEQPDNLSNDIFDQIRRQQEATRICLQKNN
ncbi:MAG: DUF4350 domain-containing protein [Myxococcota bacterium]|nr:DUF4350 domain-containing protein [Myxococcota bacterium]